MSSKLTWRERLTGRRMADRERVVGSGSTGSVSTVTSGSRGGVTLVNPYSQHPVVYSCVKLLADNVAQVPFKIVTASNTKGDRHPRVRFNTQRFQRRDGRLQVRDMEHLCRAEGVDVVDDHPYVTLFDRPNPLESGNQFWQAVTTFLTYSGECDIYCEDRADVTKIPTSLLPVDPVYFIPKPERKLIPDVWQYQNIQLQIKKLLQPYELIRPRLFNPQDLRRGLSPLQVAKVGLAMDWNARLYNKAFFENDATPGGFFFSERPLKKDQRDDWLRGYYKQHQGSANAFKWALLEGIRDVKPITMSPKDAQFSNLMKMDKEELAMIWRIPMVMLSRTADINYATDKAERRGLWTTTLVPIIRHLEDIFWSELFQYTEGGRYWGVFDLSQVEDLQEDVDAKLEQADKLHKMNVPFNLINERLGLGFEPIVGGDTVLVPANYIPLEAALAGAGIPPEPAEPSTQGGASGAHQDWENNERASAADVYKAFDRLREKHVEKFIKVYRDYLREYRKSVLDNIDRNYRAVDFATLYLGAEEQWNRRLVDMTAPGYDEAFEAALEHTAAELGAPTPFLTMTNPDAIKALEERKVAIVGTNTTLRNNLRTSIAEGMAEHETVKQIKDRAKKVLNFQDSRALTIARTEMGSAMSDARFLEMKGDGVTYASWTTAGALATPSPRRSHLEAEAVGPQPLGKTFASTGCRFPHDPQGAPEEVINCRCVLVPDVRVPKKK